MLKSIFLFFFIGLPLCCYAQEATQEELVTQEKELIYDTAPIEGTSLSKENIEDYKNDPDFNYTEIEPEDTWLSRLNRKLSEIWNSFIKWITGGQEATGIWAFLLGVLPYLFIAGLLALLVWVFFKIDNARAIINPNHKGVFMGDDEEIIKNQDIQSFIDKALKDKNYRLAVRYYYLFTLQQLSGKELIDWQAQKTNHEYIYEIKNNDLRSQFGKLTDVYDYIWYGNFEVDEIAFAKAQLAFNKMNKEI